jgi:hypothetical protein
MCDTRMSSQGSAILLFVLTLALIASGCGPDAPNAPSELSAESKDGAIVTNWTASGSGSVSGYNVYRSEDSIPEISEAEKVNDSLVEGTSYVDRGTENRTTYHYRVTAVSTSGGFLGIGGGAAESDPSGEVKKTPFSAPPDRP